MRSFMIRHQSDCRESKANIFAATKLIYRFECRAAIGSLNGFLNPPCIDIAVTFNDDFSTMN